jgi:hypothetical protein
MSLPLALAVNIFADMALIGLLTYVMSQANLLSPRASVADDTPRRLPQPACGSASRRAREKSADDPRPAAASHPAAVPGPRWARGDT